MIFDDDIWSFIKTFLFNQTDIQRRISRNKQEIHRQLILKNYYRRSIFDIYDKIMDEVFEEDLQIF
jgi:hypothetical protein